MSSPRTPRHSRHSSLAYTTPSADDSTPRRDSRASIQSPHTPSQQNFHRSDSINNIDVFRSGGPTPTVNGLGLGNLADELADAWGSDEGEGEGEDEEPDMNFQEVSQLSEDIETTTDGGADVSPIPQQQKPSHLNTPVAQRGHRRQPSDYDGSDYGGSSDLESPGMPPALVARMDMVESLARRGTENNGTERDSVVSRVVENLKDLGSQSGVESGATRYIYTVLLSAQLLTIPGS